MISEVVARGQASPSGQVIFLVGESQPDQVGELLGAYLSRREVERVVLVTADPAAASRVAAPFAAQREEGRLATVLAVHDLDSAIAAASRGWGEPDVMIDTRRGQLAAARQAPARLVYAAD